MAVVRGNALRMELHAVHRQFGVLETHDQAIAGLRRNRKLDRQAFPVDNQGFGNFGDYGEDGAAGAKIAAEANGASFEFIENAPGASLAGAIDTIVSDNPDLVFIAGTPAQLAVVARATREDPAERYPAVAALAAAWRDRAG